MTRRVFKDLSWPGWPFTFTAGLVIFALIVHWQPAAEAVLWIAAAIDLVIGIVALIARNRERGA